MSRYSVFGDRMVAKADTFAFAAHSAINQRRKYTGEPYIVHPREVAGMVQATPDHIWQQVVLALLHDVVEDTGVTLDQIKTEFGVDIHDGVYFLTNVGKEAGNRATRHQINCARLRHAPSPVATVKCLDIYSNVRQIVDLDPKFAVQYLREKSEAMECLRQADQAVWRTTIDLIGRQRALCVERGLAA